MENVYAENSTRLVDSISVLGLSVATLRSMFMNNKSSAPAEIILQLPPETSAIKPSHMEMVFTQGDITLEVSPKIPKYFSTTITDENGSFLHLHCLITYECITPVTIHNSKDRVSSLADLNIVPSEIGEEINVYTSYIPVALCLVTSSSYVDLFREILESLFSFLIDIRSCEVEEDALVASMEFMRAACLLLNDAIIPPYDVQLILKIGGSDLVVPVEPSAGLLHIEKCVAVLVDLIDIRNIIELWESLLLNRQVVLMSCNEYLLYLILEAFKELLFPLKWSLYIVPVLGPKLFDYLAAPVPILIGLNSSQITLKQVLAENSNAVVLDIDSNILYSKEPQMLCNCQKSIISKKLQLAKVYYYVSSERQSSYRMHSLETNIEDHEFVNTAKSLLKVPVHEREKIFIALVKDIFLDFFVNGLKKLRKCFVFDSFKEKFEFNRAGFMETVQKCDSCKMEKFWDLFLQSSTFDQFLELEGKQYNSEYTRFMEILDSKNRGEYKIYEPKTCYTFEIDRAISPRDLLQVIRTDEKLKSECFLTDSINYLRAEVKTTLMDYKDYYRCGEVIGRYRARKISFSAIGESSDEIKGAFDLYYGSYGIIRVTSLLLSHLTVGSFKKLSLLHKEFLIEVDEEIKEKESIWDVLILKLFFLIKDSPKLWDVKEVIHVLSQLNGIQGKKIESVSQIIAGILNEIIKIDKALGQELGKIGGPIGCIFKGVQGRHINRSVVLDGSKTEKTLLAKGYTMAINEISVEDEIRNVNHRRKLTLPNVL